MKIQNYLASNRTIPVLIGLLVVPLALTLLTIGARSPYTQANLNVAYDPDYNRTEQTFVGPDLPYKPGGLAAAPASDAAAHGAQLFVSNGCAGCHGLNGTGAIVGPSIAGVTQAKLKSKTHQGPGAMPAFAPAALTDNELAALAAFLAAPK
jgi:mono/diheme cytochrome c family protein